MPRRSEANLESSITRGRSSGGPQEKSSVVRWKRITSPSNPPRPLAPRGDGMMTIYDVLVNGEVVGRILKAGASVARPWMWTLDIGYHDDRSPIHGYAATREAAMSAFAKSWRRE